MRLTRVLYGGPKMPGGFIQDGPPKGGFPQVDVRRNIKQGGPSTLVVAAGLGAMFTYGMYVVVMANRERRAHRREEMDIRMAVMPFLQAESDVKYAGILPAMPLPPRRAAAACGSGVCAGLWLMARCSGGGRLPKQPPAT